MQRFCVSNWNIKQTSSFIRMSVKDRFKNHNDLVLKLHQRTSGNPRHLKESLCILFKNSKTRYDFNAFFWLWDNSFLYETYISNKNSIQLINQVEQLSNNETCLLKIIADFDEPPPGNFLTITTITHIFPQLDVDTLLNRGFISIVKRHCVESDTIQKTLQISHAILKKEIQSLDLTIPLEVIQKLLDNASGSTNEANSIPWNVISGYLHDTISQHPLELKKNIELTLQTIELMKRQGEHKAAKKILDHTASLLPINSVPSNPIFETLKLECHTLEFLFGEVDMGSKGMIKLLHSCDDSILKETILNRLLNLSSITSTFRFTLELAKKIIEESGRSLLTNKPRTSESESHSLIINLAFKIVARKPESNAKPADASYEESFEQDLLHELLFPALCSSSREYYKMCLELALSFEKNVRPNNLEWLLSNCALVASWTREPSITICLTERAARFAKYSSNQDSYRSSLLRSIYWGTWSESFEKNRGELQRTLEQSSKERDYLFCCFTSIAIGFNAFFYGQDERTINADFERAAKLAESLNNNTYSSLARYCLRLINSNSNSSFPKESEVKEIISLLLQAEETLLLSIVSTFTLFFATKLKSKRLCKYLLSVLVFNSETSKGSISDSFLYSLLTINLYSESLDRNLVSTFFSDVENVSFDHEDFPNLVPINVFKKYYVSKSNSEDLKSLLDLEIFFNSTGNQRLLSLLVECTAEQSVVSSAAPYNARRFERDISIGRQSILDISPLTSPSHTLTKENTVEIGNPRTDSNNTLFVIQLEAALGLASSLSHVSFSELCNSSIYYLFNRFSWKGCKLVWLGKEKLRFGVLVEESVKLPIPEVQDSYLEINRGELQLSEFEDSFIELWLAQLGDIFPYNPEPDKHMSLTNLQRKLTKILYLEMNSPYATAYFDTKETQYEDHRLTSGDISDWFRDHKLVKVHRSYFVNSDYVESAIKKERDFDIIICDISKNRKSVPISRRLISKLKTRFPHWFR